VDGDRATFGVATWSLIILCVYVLSIGPDSVSASNRRSLPRRSTAKSRVSSSYSLCGPSSAADAQNGSTATSRLSNFSISAFPSWLELCCFIIHPSRESFEEPEKPARNTP
jgi:hypothetical protein